MPAAHKRQGPLIKFCSIEHRDQYGRYKLSSHTLEQDEDAALFEAAKAAGQYLDSLQVYDLRYLSKAKLLMFTSIIVAKFAETNPKYDPLDDEIPF